MKTPTADQLLNLAAWRAAALELMPYFGSMLFSLKPVNAVGLGTFAVDAQHRLYIDFDAVAPKGLAWCSEALLHECGHLFGEHARRAKELLVTPETHRMWNLAADAEINDDLVSAGCRSIGDDGVTPTKLRLPDNQLAEFYYEELARKAAAKPKPKPSQSDPEQGQDPGQAPGQTPSNKPSTGSGEEPAAAAAAASPGSGEAAGQATAEDFNGCGSGSGGEAAPGEFGDGDEGGASDQERFRVRVATAAAITQASGQGTVPAGLLATAESILAPGKIPWRTTLAACIRRAVKRGKGSEQTTFNRVNRRRRNVRLGNGSKVIYPGTFTPKITMAVVEDTSGSMGADEIALAHNEIVSIASSMKIKGDDLRIVQVDAAVGSIKGYQGHAKLADITGRGGTDMRVGIEAAMKLIPAPTAVVIITDGYTPWPAEPTPIPLIICIVGDGGLDIAGQAPEWAKVVVVDQV